jgi:very-short-patch-repair endonuclease
LEFEKAYEGFIKFHFDKRHNATKSRLRGGLEHAERTFLENVWWPAFHHFDSLHPEYKIYDFKDGHRYIDFAYIRPHFRIAIEIDGISTHWKDISLAQFSDHCMRQNHLVIDGWHVLRFSYMDVEEHPRLCQQTLQQLIGKLMGDSRGIILTLSVIDREIVRLVMGSNQPMTAADLSKLVHMGSDAVAKHLRRLSDANWLEPASGYIRIRSYRIHSSKSGIHI